MNVNAVNTKESLINQVHPTKNTKGFELGNATRETTSSGDGEKIGLFTVETGLNESTVYFVTYADNSTPANPIVKIGDYEIEVNKVDPENATEMELCALLSHLDKTYPGVNHGMSSFSKARAFGYIGEQNGFCSGIKDPKHVYTKKQDWTAILERMKTFFADNPITYEQSLDCENLLFLLSKA